MISNLFYATAILTLLFITVVAAATSVKVNQTTPIKDIACPAVFYECPENSSVKPNTTCVTSFKNCHCNFGYKKNVEKQICDPIVCPMIFYKCPINSYLNPKSVCLTSFHDCKCEEGYVRNEFTQSCVMMKSPTIKSPTALESPVLPPVAKLLVPTIQSPAMAPIVKELKKCSTTAAVSGCNDGYSCTYDPTKACIAMVGADCPGICVPTCSGRLMNSINSTQCPKFTKCVNNPATPQCTMEADCTGVCLLKFMIPKSPTQQQPPSAPKAPVVKSPIRSPMTGIVKTPVIIKSPSVRSPSRIRSPTTSIRPPVKSPTN